MFLNKKESLLIEPMWERDGWKLKLTHTTQTHTLTNL
jgi:hypothetical protein